MPADVPSVENILGSLVDSPKPSSKDSVHESGEPYAARTVNYLEREAANMALGKAGELFVVNFEKARLASVGKERLMDRVEHVAVTQGDGLGFDVRSFEANGDDRLIEVKTTRFGIDTPFFVTSNELRFSSSHSDRYHLYRVFRFSRGPRLFSCQGYLEDYARLEPSQFVGRIG